MKRTSVVLCALLLPFAVLAADPSPSMSDAMKKAAASDTTKGFKAKALSRIGMDYTPSAPGARVYIIEPKNGAEISGPVTVLFGLSGMGIAPAGVQKDNTGHHHLLIDGPAFDTNAALPVTDQIKHFGGGQTEATLTLKPGKHTLQLVFGDWKHQPHNPPLVSDTVSITVK